jgi:ubiquinone/menaquinone biosynthesis C-methylase UbiE
MRGIRCFAGIALLVPLAGTAWPQVAERANQGYETPEQRSRVARNLDDPDREENQKPRELLTALGVSKGDVVADIGTGIGFMLPYLAEAVGPQGRVYAEDIFPDFLDKAKHKIHEQGWKNVETVLGAEKDVMLPPGAVDLALVLDVYHHFNYPADVLASIRKALKPAGRLVVIDFYRSRQHPRMTPERLNDHIRLDRDGFAAEIQSAGFRLERQFDHLPHQYVLVFVRN